MRVKISCFGNYLPARHSIRRRARRADFLPAIQRWIACEPNGRNAQRARDGVTDERRIKLPAPTLPSPALGRGQPVALRSPWRCLSAKR
jgi:hypothetical protein